MKLYQVNINYYQKEENNKKLKISKKKYLKLTNTQNINRFNINTLNKYIKEKNYNMILLLGMSSVGKSFISKKIDNYKHINIDDILRPIAKKHKDGNKIYSIYSKDKYPEIKKEIINTIKKLSTKKIIIDGPIFNISFINDILKINKNHLIVYAQPSSIKKYTNNYIKKLQEDFKNNTKRTFIWKLLNENEYNYLKNNKKINNFILRKLKKLARKRMGQLFEDYKLFNNLDYVILNI